MVHKIYFLIEGPHLSNSRSKVELGDLHNFFPSNNPVRHIIGKDM
jgi:hypothetical protein